MPDLGLARTSSIPEPYVKARSVSLDDMRRAKRRSSVAGYTVFVGAIKVTFVALLSAKMNHSEFGAPALLGDVMQTSMGALCAAFCASMYFRSYFGIVGPHLAADLGLSGSQFGWLTSGFFTSFALLQIPVGIAFDKWGVRWPMTAMMVLGAAGSALVASSYGLWSALFGQMAIGAGCSPIFMGVLYYLGRVYPSEQAGRYAAIVSSAGSLGALISALPLSWFSIAVGWRSACWTAATVMLLCSTVVGFSLGHTPSVQSKEIAPSDPTPIRSLVYLLPICFTLSIGGTFRNAWAGPYVKAMFGDTADIGLVLTVVSIFGIAFSFALPFLLLRFQNRTIIITVYGAGVTCALLIVVKPDLSLFSAVAALAVLYAMGNLHPLAMAEAQALLPLRMRGLGLGALNTLIFLGVAASSSVFGGIADRSLPALMIYRLIFVVTAAVLAISLTLYIAFRPRHRKKPAPG